MFSVIDKKKFDKLLNWLDSDRETAALQYEHIRRALIKIFLGRGCFNAEDLADKTFDRVILKIETLDKNYQGEKVFYFLGVARYIIKELNRNKEVQISDVKFAESIRSPVITDVDDELIYKKDCLKECLKQLPKNQRTLIVDYFGENYKKKNKSRKITSGKILLTDNALRNQVFRIRKKIFKCFYNCLKEKKP